jgi:hypothetical protein
MAVDKEKLSDTGHVGARPSADFIDSAHRSREVCGRLFRYAIATGPAKHDIAADLIGSLALRTTQHHAAIIDPAKVGELLRAI